MEWEHKRDPTISTSAVATREEAAITLLKEQIELEFRSVPDLYVS